MNAIEGQKIYRISDCEWWAGPSAESVIAACAARYDMPEAEVQGNHFAELTDEEADQLQFVLWERGGDGPNKTFREQLVEMVNEKEAFPRFFATTEI